MAPAPHVLILCQLIAYKLLEVACLLLRLAITTLRRRLYSPHDASPKKSPLAMIRTHSNTRIEASCRNPENPGATSGACNELCATCQSIVDKIRYPQWHKDLLHHESLVSLEESSGEFCGLCTELLGYLKTDTIEKETGTWETLFPIRCESNTSAASWQSEFELIFTSDNAESFRRVFVFEVVDDVKGQQCYTHSSSTNSWETRSTTDYWMKQCIENHTQCNPNVSGDWAPTRLVDVGSMDDKRIRIVRGEESIPSRRGYAALSYCWGASTPFCTTKRNLDLFERKGIDWEELPKTIQDAIDVTRRLSIRYIWIDRLCIAQDDQQDWLRESRVMDQIYTRSSLTLVAAAAKDVSEGCYRERDPRAVLPTKASIQWSNCIGSRARSYLVVPGPQDWAQPLAEGPVYSRAWTFQEQILSPRTLHFAEKQLFWECREQSACETYPEGLPFSLRRNQFFEKQKLQLYSGIKDDCWPAEYVSSNPSGSDYWSNLWRLLTTRLKPDAMPPVVVYASRKAAPAFQVWDDVVEEYSKRSLTFDKDKLIAMSGLARAYVNSFNESGATCDGYLAGIWQSSLPTYLLWKTAEEELSWSDKWIMPSNTHYRPKHYVAPSWSWPSVMGRISLDWCQSNYHRRDYLTEVEDASVTCQGKDRFGQVQSGHITLSGPVASMLWKYHSPPLDRNAGRSAQAHAWKRGPSPRHAAITHLFPRHLKSAMSVSVPPRSSIEPEVFFDTITEEKPSELILVSIIGIPKRSAHGSETVIGLVLKESEKSEVFVRIGVFYAVRLQVGRMLRNMPRQSVTII